MGGLTTLGQPRKGRPSVDGAEAPPIRGVIAAGLAVGLASIGPGVGQGDGIARIHGLNEVMAGRIAQIPVSEAYLGRVINDLTKPIDGRGEILASESRLIESPAPGRGQRELIIGDMQIGKTAVATYTILNQKGQNVICVYVAIGQKASSVAQIATTFQEQGAMEFIIVVAEPADSPATLQYLAPYTGAALAEYFIARERAIGTQEKEERRGERDVKELGNQQIRRQTDSSGGEPAVAGHRRE
ncbi:hypothetical protein Syun_009712 [Stephania yunnanensis]|uniref:ATPase F1/V1/A1 complex alpha/beta subunit nucleotide-binding domain-containing protein n=1 Tax=Stephania yunnanensis TaxID=152371 RepID=A0AAP0PNU7_9MAGN